MSKPKSWFEQLLYYLRQDEVPDQPDKVPDQPIDVDRCPACEAALRAADRFCSQCGTPISSAGMETQRLTLGNSALQRWKSTGKYRVCVYGIVEQRVRSSLRGAPANERSVCVEVGYSNESRETLKHRAGQWSLYDTDGYCYQMRMESYLYHELHNQRLSEGWLSPGRQVRGWVAFAVPAAATLDYVQFMSGYLNGKVLDFSLRRLS